ncbi:hypothetical protein [Nafulsella turpanensis]|uniref:hypothetical protein n=1 Tax=Nafulsella turpanensis TaxID=1265690 RepID=UPI000349A50B|nr:hypothetical protein [Nafulsella turpanensis]
MKTIFSILACQFLALTGFAQTEFPSRESQLKSTVLAAPEDKRAEATVYGFSQEGKLILLRKGSNNMVCLADDPEKEGFSASCYPQSLEPFMKRGRELREQGKSYQEVFDTREQEVKSGQLKMPEQPSILYVFSAPAEKYNPASGEVKDGSFRYVVYIPYATAESTGLPLKPEAPGMPWLMDPGTHRAHIMISPPAPEKE